MVARYVSLFVLVVAGLAGGSWEPAWAEPAWARLLTFDRPDADPEKTYRLGEQNGPWLIMAATFEGQAAEQQADELALELRQRYKLRAYVHTQEFTYEVPGEAQRAARAFARSHKRYRREGGKQIAVLVGDFPDAADPDAQRALKKIKYLEPESLRVEKGENTYQHLAGWRSGVRKLQAMVESAGGSKAPRGPMGAAFLTTNPLLPDEFFTPAGVDQFVLKMNQHVEHSLLDCPGKFSLQVATFHGNTSIKQDEIEDIQNGKKEFKSALEVAALKAHQLTGALRAKGYDAYEFHDRYASLVAVGSFESAGTPRADGKIEINPELHALMQAFGSRQSIGGGQFLVPKTIVGIPLDMQPIPIVVPRRSISRDYDSSMFGLLR